MVNKKISLLKSAPQMKAYLMKTEDGTSCFWPVYAEMAMAFEAKVEALLFLEPVRFGLRVTGVDVLDCRGGVLLRHDDTGMLPFAAFKAMVSKESLMEAWVTDSWVTTDAIGTPLYGSLLAALWLLDKEAGVQQPALQDGEYLAFVDPMRRAKS